jgi:two-component system, chemotaxis family, protein-glutamate methylesterase/glutaminase
MLSGKVDMVVFGGSAGSLDVLLQVLPYVKHNISYSIVIVVHRKYSEISSLSALLAARTNFTVKEPEDKEEIKKGMVYLAPADYHLLIEQNHVFSLDYSEKVNYSRPSIDVTFDSAADVYHNRLVAVLLSGANADGVKGLKNIGLAGGFTIVQDPNTASTPYMPEQAVKFSDVKSVMSPQKITDFLNSL